MSMKQDQKTYKKPELIVYGTVAQITMTSGDGLIDDNNGKDGTKSALSMMS